MEKHCSLTFLFLLPPYKPVALLLSRISSILKHPNKSFLNPYKYIFDIFYTHSIYCFFNIQLHQPLLKEEEVLKMHNLDVPHRHRRVPAMSLNIHNPMLLQQPPPLTHPPTPPPPPPQVSKSKATQEQCNYHCVTILDCNYR
jgi:hypothetical protein